MQSALADRISVFAISAPSPTLWDSPRSLLSSTVQNSVRSTYAPNGHLMILIEQGDHAWLTSMASAKKFQTFSSTVRQGLGLSALYYDFVGTMDSAEDSVRLLNRASKDNRAAEMDIDVDPATMKHMLKFLDQWITGGSFRHYRGGQIASPGLGAGCADFVMWFMNQALEGRAPLASWMREVFLPSDLLAGTSPVAIYKRREWAKSAEDGRFFMIPDPELIYHWIVERSPVDKKIQVHADQLAGEKIHFSAQMIQGTPFVSTFPTESPDVVKKMWDSIQIR